MRVQIAEQVSPANVDGTLVLLAGNGDAAVLNSSGSWILERLTEETDVNEIADAICEHFLVSRDEASRDLADFMSKLSKHKLVVLDD